jgi:hypothetical protein
MWIDGRAANTLAVIDDASLENRIYREHTEVRACVVEDWPNAQTVWIRVGVQQFCVTPHACETPEEADWMRKMLSRAMMELVRRMTPYVELTGAAPTEGDKSDD